MPSIYAFPTDAADIYRAETIEESIDRKAREILEEIIEMASRPLESLPPEKKCELTADEQRMFTRMRGMQNAANSYYELDGASYGLFSHLSALSQFGLAQRKPRF